MANTAAENGVFYGLVSESECTAVCLTSPNCVAVDLGPIGCVLHNNIDDLTTAYNASGFTQLVLNRHCLPTTLPSVSVEATNLAEFAGIEITNTSLNCRLSVPKAPMFMITDSVYQCKNATKAFCCYS